MLPFFVDIFIKNIYNNSMMIKYYGNKKSVELKTESFLGNLSRYDISQNISELNNNYSLEYIEWDMLRITDKQRESFELEHAKSIIDNFHPGVHHPVCVAYYNGEYIVWDGHHSAVAAYKTGMTKAPCVVFKCDTLEDFQKLLDSDTIIKFDEHQLSIMFEEFTQSIK